MSTTSEPAARPDAAGVKETKIEWIIEWSKGNPDYWHFGGMLKTESAAKSALAQERQNDPECEWRLVEVVQERRVVA